MNEPITFNTRDVMEKIIKVRGMDVLLDRDVAELYGVETKRVNEAIKNYCCPVKHFHQNKN